MAKLIVQFSGGKDSMASLLWVRNNISKDFLTVFCDTGWESPLTYKYINEAVKRLDLNYIVLSSKKYAGFLDLAKKKKRFPSTKARFCTTELKSIPMIDYILDEVKEDILIIQGIRKAESESRSLMNAQCTFFKFYFEPYRSNEIIINRLSVKQYLSKSQKITLANAKKRISKGFKDEKFHTYRKKEIIEFRKNYADDILRPVFDWSGQQVIDYIVENGIEPNPLYKMGMKRVGCYPCIMSNNVDIRSIDKFDPARLDMIEEEEILKNSSFFGPDSIPSWAYKGEYPLMADVRKYLKDKNASGDLFGGNETSCMSFYGLCE
jgi:3'-phosphoadenosine 5'-phosphosulfate sulfotransferase (PAPS reductase)/FAD synthetase